MQHDNLEFFYFLQNFIKIENMIDQYHVMIYHVNVTTQ